ncbi:hypothetical protein BC940DRAFT_238655 [Gongronella butleri]|nr:hypothetical protein BC940DRAFT_238655 [Gongronella butleri]
MDFAAYSFTDQLKSDFDEREQVYLRFSHGGFFDTLHPAPLDLSDDDEWGDEEAEYDEKNRYQRMQYQAKKDQAKITEAALALGDERAKLEVKKNCVFVNRAP